MKMRDLKTIETTYEVIEGGFIYRVNVSDKGAFIKRTKKIGGAWTHSVLTEIWNTDQRKFLPLIENINITFVQFRDIEDIINGTVLTRDELIQKHTKYDTDGSKLEIDW